MTRPTRLSTPVHQGPDARHHISGIRVYGNRFVCTMDEPLWFCVIQQLRLRCLSVKESGRRRDEISHATGGGRRIDGDAAQCHYRKLSMGDPARDLGRVHGELRGPLCVGQHRRAGGARTRVQARTARFADHRVLCRLYGVMPGRRDSRRQVWQPSNIGDLDVSAWRADVLLRFRADVLDGSRATSVDGFRRRCRIWRDHQDPDGVVRQGQGPRVRYLGDRHVDLGRGGERNRARIAAAYGWQVAYQILGIATLVFSLICFCVIRNTPDGQSVPRITAVQIASLLKNRNLLLLALGGAGALYGTLGFVAWANALMSVAHGISPVVAGSVLVWFGVGAFVSKPLFGWLYDRLVNYAKVVAIIDLVIFIVLLTVFGNCSSISAYYAIAPFLGAAAYGYTPLLIGLYTQASGPQLAGAAAGFVNTVWSVGSFISPILAGYVFQHGRSLNNTLGVIAIGPLLSVILLCFVRRHVAAES